MNANVRRWQRAKWITRFYSTLVTFRVLLAVMVGFFSTLFSLVTADGGGPLIFLLGSVNLIIVLIVIAKFIGAILGRDEKLYLKQLTRAEGGNSAVDRFLHEVHDLASLLGIDAKVIDKWIDLRDLSQSPRILYADGRHHLIAPIGFLGMLQKSPGPGRAMLAHELAHVAQGDARTWRFAKAFSASVMRYQFKYTCWMSVIGGVLMLLAITRLAVQEEELGMLNLRLVTQSQLSHLEDRLAVDRGQAYSGLVNCIAAPILLLAFNYSVWRLVRKSEEWADWGAACFVGTQNMEQALSMVAVRGNEEGGWLSSHPSTEERRRRLQRMSA